MKKLFILFILCMGITYSIKGENDVESLNSISIDNANQVCNFKAVRKINGGSVILPEFDSSCPEEIKGPFSFACKIVEEYIPPTLPLRIRVSVGRVNSSSSSETISKVTFKTFENFGNNFRYNNSPLSMIKGILLGELSYGANYTYIESIPDAAFLTEFPDIEIVYNQDLMDQLYCSLDIVPEVKYDFITVAVRDILKGLGLTSGYRMNPATQVLINPARELLPFEKHIDEIFKTYGADANRYDIATSGSINLYSEYGRSLLLYAPDNWVNGVSLNYFIPQSDSDISNILRHDLPKGYVYRSLDDQNSNWIFRNLLGWIPEFTTGGGYDYSATGSTSYKMPYNGSYSIDSSLSSSVESVSTVESNIIRNNNIVYDSSWNDLSDYLRQFHPYSPERSTSIEGITISVLKKDGAWDVVKSQDYFFSNFSFTMDDLKFNYPIEQYSRTIDGYLRARVTTKSNENNTIRYKSTFFVIDYLPSKLELNFKFINNSVDASIAYDMIQASSAPIRIYFKNLEGVERVVMERLRSGQRLPSKMEISDFKNGYIDTYVDKDTQFTFVSYNGNGYTRSNPISISPASDDIVRNFDNDQFVQSNDTQFAYRIESVYNGETIDMGYANHIEDIDYSTLKKGFYILTFTDANNEIILIKKIVI